MTTTTPLPQLEGRLMLTDGGLETTLVFHDGLELPAFAAFVLLRDEAGTARLRSYYEGYAAIAERHGTGLVLESPTWRASHGWAEETGLDADEVDELNRKAIALLHEVRAAWEARVHPIVVSGCVGPEGDGYSPSAALDEQEAQAYHARQVAQLREAGVDLVTAITMTYAEEAIGVTRAAQAAGLPVAISFTVETDGRLPSGETLADAIARVDAATGDGPAYYMVNCAHPTHFEAVLEPEASWTRRIRGLRANASALSHAELDEATELDDGDPEDLGARHARLRAALPHVTVLGGCCGTDERHVDAIARAWAAG